MNGALNWLSTCVFFLLSAMTWPLSAQSDEEQTFFEYESRRPTYRMRRGADDSPLIEVGGILLRPNFDGEFEDPEAPIREALSPDERRSIIWVDGLRNERNIWVLNLEKKRTEFELLENRGRHLFVAWPSADRFTLTFAGMGYAIAYSYQFDDGIWELRSTQKIQ